MRRLPWLLLLVGCGDEATTPQPLTPEVDVFIGTGGLGFGVGSMTPGPYLPFALARPGPDTSTLGGGAPGFSHCAGYWWEDDEVRAFSQVHLVGTGVPDLGVLGLMPAVQLPPRVRASDYRQRFDHRREDAAVGYYSVELQPSQVKVDLTSTARTALYRFTYPEGPRLLVLDLTHGLNGETIDSELTVDGNEVFGWLHHKGGMSGGYGGFRLYFVIRLDRPVSAELLQDGQRQTVSSLRGAKVGAVLSLGGDGPVSAQIGLSYVDEAGARANLEAEWANFDFDSTRARAVAAWEPLLGQVQVEGGSAAERKKFYTALFHSYAMPTHFADVDGRYRGVDNEIRSEAGFRYYTDLSLWDTFRTAHPLYSFLVPTVQRDINRSMLAMTQASGRIPKWPLGPGETNTMISYHGETVWADSYLRGVTDFDYRSAWSYSRDAAFMAGGVTNGRQRDCGSDYLNSGYCAQDAENGSVSKTLENAFGDFVLAQMARSLGEAQDATVLEARGEQWQQLFDPSLRVTRGKRRDGSLDDTFSPARFGDEYVEGNSLQWSTFVPHAPMALAEASGGVDAFVEHLDGVFRRTADAEDTPLPDTGYWHGNEPDLHAAYMFAEVGRPERTEAWVDWIRRTRYAANPAGLDGNDDGGTLSAWFVWSAMGLFPKVGEARYVFGPPLFPKLTVSLENGKTLEIVAEGWTEGATRVTSVSWNGTPVSGPYLEHRQLLEGGTLRFVMESR